MRPDERCDMMEPSFGAAEFVRVWCTADDSALNPYRRLEFCGWPVAWGDAELTAPVSVFPYQGTPYTATRLDVTLYLTSEGRIVTALELAPDAPREFASSPPDVWTTFLDEHDDLDAAARWLHAVHGHMSPGVPWPLLDELVQHAGTALPPLTPG